MKTKYLQYIQALALDYCIANTLEQPICESLPCITADGALVLLPTTIHNPHCPPHYSSILLKHYRGYITVVNFKSIDLEPVVIAKGHTPYLSYLSQDGNTIVTGVVSGGLQQVYVSTTIGFKLVVDDIHTTLLAHQAYFTECTWVYRKPYTQYNPATWGLQ